jgi:uncharacterized protein YdaU (DUF1376 family)
MAAIPYMPFYVADYLADAAHLTTLEHGAYLLLIMNYWQRGEPLPDNDRKLSRIVGMLESEWVEVRESLSEFFTIIDGFWHHGRIDRELDKVRAKSEKARSAGKVSAERRFNDRSTDVQQPFNERSTSAEQTFNHTDTDTDTDTDTGKKDKKRTGVRVAEKPDDVSQEVWDDFKALRAKLNAPLSVTALAGIRRESEKAGIPLEMAMQKCCERGWRGFNAEWVAGKNPRDGTTTKYTAITLQNAKNLESFVNGSA